jgi:hypothetical protein
MDLLIEPRSEICRRGRSSRERVKRRGLIFRVFYRGAILSAWLVSPGWRPVAVNWRQESGLKPNLPRITRKSIGFDWIDIGELILPA